MDLWPKKGRRELENWMLGTKLKLKMQISVSRYRKKNVVGQNCGSTNKSDKKERKKKAKMNAFAYWHQLHWRVHWKLGGNKDNYIYQNDSNGYQLTKPWQVTSSRKKQPKKYRNMIYKDVKTC